MAKKNKQNYYLGDILLDSDGRQIKIVKVTEGEISWTYDAIDIITKKDEWFYECESEGVRVKLEVITQSIKRLFSK